jgi:hypothetical protein
MPNELLMELFEYYDFYSLVISFSSLNSRLDNLLHHCQLHIDLDRIEPIDFIDFLAHTLPKFNPKNIQSLHGSNPYEIGVLAYDKSLIYFTHIRSLSLNNTPSNIIQCMISRIHFSSLQRVSLGKCENGYNYRRSLVKDFFDSNRYQFLRTYKDIGGIIQEITSESSIEYITLSGESIPSAFLNLLNRLPYLKHMTAVLLFLDYFPKPIFLYPIPYHYKLTHLNLRLLNDVCMTTVDYLFKCIPQIYNLKLKIESKQHPDLFNPIFWETLLSKYLVELKRLSLEASTFDMPHPIDPIWNFLMDKDKVIKQIESSNYWSSHQWKATFDTVLPTPPFNRFWVKFKVI